MCVWPTPALCRLAEVRRHCAQSQITAVTFSDSLRKSVSPPVARNSGMDSVKDVDSSIAQLVDHAVASAEHPWLAALLPVTLVVMAFVMWTLFTKLES